MSTATAAPKRKRAAKPMPRKSAAKDERAEAAGAGGKRRGAYRATKREASEDFGAAGRPQYVVKIEPEFNRVMIGDDPDLLRKRFSVRDVNWIAVAGATEPISCQIQIRNRFEPQAGRVMLDNGRIVVEFDTPQRAVTPGQGAVFYWDDIVVGGGWIAA